MSRSNSYNFAFTRNTLITAAFQLVNIIQVSDTVSSEDMAYAVVLLNAMIKDWEADGINLWKRRQGVLFTAKSTNSYQIGSSGSNATTSFVNTTISANEALGQTTLSITSSTGMTINDYIGIKLDDGTRQWTTISSIPNSTSVIVTDALTSAAASGNTVVSYTTKINRPLRILRGTVFDLVSSNESQLSMNSYDEYFDIPFKTTAGSPNNFYYDKLLDNGVLYLFPTPNEVDKIIKFTYHDALMDMDNINDDFDFPSEWYMTLLYNLAVELCYAYQKLQELPVYENKANLLKLKAKSWDGDEESLQISINRRSL